MSSDLDEIAWRIVGDLSDAASWVPGVVAPRVIGDLRLCVTADGQEIRERLSSVEGEPNGVPLRTSGDSRTGRHQLGILRVRPGGRGCAVEWGAAFEPADPTHAEQITAMMRANFANALESLRRRIEAVPVNDHALSG